MSPVNWLLIRRPERKSSAQLKSKQSKRSQNVGEILKAAGSDLSRVLKITIYISDIELWSAVNSVYAKVMGEHRPARAIVPTKELHYGFLIEIEAIAAV